MADDLTCLSYRFPKIKAAGVRVPKTRLITMPVDLQVSLHDFVVDGAALHVNPRPVFDQIRVAGDEVGWPCFLRTTERYNRRTLAKTNRVAAARIAHRRKE